ncbi:Flp family type IVb pilin [Desulfallas sp. Bu1-1]|uniref:Flp family type IVb pilin n=1 Tax=Desulfallas sp. Bu1-1 TaxID=2787620 RepID=UPI001FAD4D18|nr:Flp family type IVb pilin [Desulfallas sp. Bu1-1]
MNLLAKLWREESGQGMVEYGLILALVSVVVIGVLATIGQKLLTKFQAVDSQLN